MKKNLLLIFNLLTSLVFAQNNDFTFNSAGDGFVDSNNSVEASALQTDGKILVVGELTKYNNTIIKNIARINFDGSLDTTFMTNVGTGFSSRTTDVSVQNDGKIIVFGGEQSTNHTFNNVAIKDIIRLNSNGTLDNTFNYYRNNNSPSSLKTIPLSNGKILVFTVSAVTRINSNGTLDNTFNTVQVTNGTISADAIKLDNNGKIIIGGSFNNVNGNSIKYLVRLNNDGSLDNTLNLGTGFL
jgi:uncharacterized delta-60 repeat protein